MTIMAICDSELSLNNFVAMYRTGILELEGDDEQDGRGDEAQT